MKNDSVAPIGPNFAAFRADASTWLARDSANTRQSPYLTRNEGVFAPKCGGLKPCVRAGWLEMIYRK